MTDITEKRCTLCKQVKPVAEFVSEFTTGLTNRCSLCRQRGQRAHSKWVGKNRENKRRIEADYRRKVLSDPLGQKERRCTSCLKVLSLEQFSIGPHGELYKQCDECREWRREIAVNARKGWSPEKRVEQAAQMLKRNQDARLTVLEHYGLKCSCCGDEHYEFLVVDHINGDGCKHRREIPGSAIYRWLVKNGFPEGFRTLCWNCNWAYRLHGHCPHQKIPQLN